ncbi:hypothetical protein [Anabaena sp. WA102]|jgi:Ca2+-binding RTX toxin-like protein|uniref:hypothetical protein n=1 Tax=Anabaena sp. WA102 TaxID=1647413 RepID=UPI0009D7580D|nr:hypothetical protein [Anabaena sp. WA102]
MARQKALMQEARGKRVWAILRFFTQFGFIVFTYLSDSLSITTDIDGGSGDDIISGGAVGDILKGGEGNDVLDGRAGDDNLTGESGDDRLFGGDGADK